MRRTIIANAAFKSGIVKKEQDIIELRKEWANDARIYSLGMSDKDVADILSKVQALKAQLPTAINYIINVYDGESCYIIVRVAGTRHRVYFEGTDRNSGAERISRKYITNDTVEIGANTSLGIRWAAIETRAREVATEREQLEAEVRAILDSVRTDTQLLKVWPEAIELLPTKVAKASLPAVQTSALNKLLKLPTEGLLYTVE